MRSPSIRSSLPSSVALIVLASVFAGCETSGDRLTRIRTYPELTAPPGASMESEEEDDVASDHTDVRDRRTPEHTRPRGIVTLATGIRVGSSWLEVASGSSDRRYSVSLEPDGQVSARGEDETDESESPSTDDAGIASSKTDDPDDVLDNDDKEFDESDLEDLSDL